ncbi:MAG: hypothetical protein AB1489_40245 [Acidobacteriota bacterium]
MYILTSNKNTTGFINPDRSSQSKKAKITSAIIDKATNNKTAAFDLSNVKSSLSTKVGLTTSSQRLSL